jgi:hypothetical protein
VSFEEVERREECIFSGYCPKCGARIEVENIQNFSDPIIKTVSCLSDDCTGVYELTYTLEDIKEL